MITAAEQRAMQRALSLAVSPEVPYGPNPRVGAVILSPNGDVVGEGYHRGAGTAHAEVAALVAAGSAAHGATAVVTLEPCRHVGRTGPCTRALLAAGVRRVVFAQTDPNPQAAGGADELRSGGIDVEGGLLADEARAINPEWTVAVERGRPFVTLKLAATLDGLVAAADGSSRWISSEESRAEVHELRSRADAVVVGTGTVLADDPELTDRRPGAVRQPLRVVIGRRSIPGGARILTSGPKALHLHTHDLAAALSTLFERDVRHLLVEGGPGLATAFLRAGLADRLIWYVAPMMLGSGRSAVEDLGIESVEQALKWTIVGVTRVGEDVRIDLSPQSASNRDGKN